MTENNRFKNFLVNGFQGLESRPEPGEEDVKETVENTVEEAVEKVEATPEEAVEAEEPEVEETAEVPEEPAMESGEAPIEVEETVEETIPDDDFLSQEVPARRDDREAETLKGIEKELITLRYMLEDLADRPALEPPDMSAYATTKEQAKAINASIARLDSSSSNKTLVRAMEQIAIMREDFFRLCKGMEERIGDLDARTVLDSFKAYEVDMENILSDAGVYIGSFDYERLNTLHQRIVGVVPTDEKEKDGTIAERQSDGYKLGDKVLLKERVAVFKYAPSGASEAAEETVSGSERETASETSSETTCGTEPSENGDGMEEKE